MAILNGIDSKEVWNDNDWVSDMLDFKGDQYSEEEKVMRELAQEKPHCPKCDNEMYKDKSGKNTYMICSECGYWTKL